MKLNLHDTGLALGVFMAFVHAVWLVLVYFGWASGFLGWVYGVHFLSNPFKVQAFNWGGALTLVAFTFIVGYFFGWFFALFWNKLHKK